MAKFEIVGFDNLRDTLTELTKTKKTVRFIHGGTDLINQINDRHFNAEIIFDLSHIKELNFIKEEDNQIKIGAGTTFTQIASSDLIWEKARCLAQASQQVGSVQIRNRATLGGNIAGASPAADSLPALIILGAQITTASPEGSRIIPLESLFVDIGKTCLNQKEIIKEISFPALDDSFISGFEKIGARKAVTIAKLSMAMMVKYDTITKSIEYGKIALGALGKSPVCPEEVNEFLNGKKPDYVFGKALAARLSEVVDYTIPTRSSRPYKREAIKGLTFNMLHNLFNISIDAGDEYDD